MGSASHEPPDWAALYAQHREAMWRAARGVLAPYGLEDDAEDAVMGAMVSLIQKPPSPPPTSWPALLVETAKRRARDRTRSAAVRRRGGPPPEEPPREQVDFVDELVDRLARAEAGGHVWDALAVLDDRDRQIIWQHVALGRSRSQVAADFGLSPGRVSQIWKAARPLLRERLERDLGNGEW